MQFCAYLHGTVVCQWQRLTKCRQYMVTWASVGVGLIFDGGARAPSLPLATGLNILLYQHKLTCSIFS